MLVCSLSEAQFERLVKALANGMTPGEAERMVGTVASDVEEIPLAEETEKAVEAEKQPAGANA